MKRRHRAKSDILIDLTSLLDVIFIVLLVVIARQQTLTEKTKDQVNSAGEVLEQAEALALEAQAKYELYMDQLEMADQLNQYVFAVSVYASYSSEDVTHRTIRILREGEEIQAFELRGEKTDDKIAAFKTAMEDYIAAHPDQPVILSLNENDEKILYRDEKAIQSVFQDLIRRYDNVFVR